MGARRTELLFRERCAPASKLLQSNPASPTYKCLTASKRKSMGLMCHRSQLSCQIRLPPKVHCECQTWKAEADGNSVDFSCTVRCESPRRPKKQAGGSTLRVLYRVITRLL